MSDSTENKGKRLVALITGITGQDGSYLAEFLLKKGYDVHGVMRRSSSFNTGRIDHIYKDSHDLKPGEPKFVLHYGDLTDPICLSRVISEISPDEIYNLGAQSHVKVSFETPEYTSEVDAFGPLRILEIMRSRQEHEKKQIKFYQASTSELYGGQKEGFLTMETPFEPRSPYAIAKQFAFWMTKEYRLAYNLFACNGILFNHESPRRGETFVTRKITRAIAAIVIGQQERIYLGNLDAKRDWGHAKDYVEAMWMMLNPEDGKPKDHVIATGEMHSVKEFVEIAFNSVNRVIQWKGEGVDEVGYEVVKTESGEDKLIERVLVDERYFRPTEVDQLLGKGSLDGWVRKYTFEDLVADMMLHDLRLMGADPEKFMEPEWYRRAIEMDSEKDRK